MTIATDGDLRSLRLARRLSLGVAAALADISKSALANWENGTSRPRGPAFARLLDTLEAEPRLRARLLHAADPAYARVALVHSPLGAPVDAGMVLRAMRERRGITQAELARRVGVTQSAVSQWEAGEAVPPAQTAHTIGFALGATVEETLALASARGIGRSELPDDPAAALDHMQRAGVPKDLHEVIFLGWEAELWRRAAHDPRWDECLISVLSCQANFLVGQERYDEIAAPARRAVSMAKTIREKELATACVAALADYDRHRGAGHAAAAEMAGAWSSALPDSQLRSWMLYQRGICLARMGLGDQGAALVAQATIMNERFMPPRHPDDLWSYHTVGQGEVRLASGDPAKAAALIGGRRERHFDERMYVRVEHANGRAVSDTDMAHLRYQGREWSDNPHARRSLERIERRQAKLTGGEPVPFAPEPTDLAEEDRLWAAVLRESRG